MFAKYAIRKSTSDLLVKKTVEMLPSNDDGNSEDAAPDVITTIPEKKLQELDVIGAGNEEDAVLPDPAAMDNS